ncbi:erythrocyte membrane protein 1, EMP1 [Plasmodium reichenowi]|uniref:Erythrocyte membrane protein 1, EMP1 n=1 Tax=Plasmodium reichenowi TaxID=5854 RepID=A0A060RTP8_PLARE|nr:erythrocyte membrane protein 1, EMP1 [Plasmodium reichenowi]
MGGDGGSRGGEEDYIEDATAKYLLDSIGKKVYDKAKDEAEQRSNGDLKGKLSQVSIKSETNNTQEPCTFDYDEHTTVAKGNTKPCGNDGEQVNRFSDKKQAEYDKKKTKCIYGSNGSKSKGANSEGACAPYRRLHLCNKNMVNMVTNNSDSKAKHDLLAEVCMAAKYEAASIIPYNDKYNATYSDSPSQLCTELARSFADIGDIVRGRDLYSGNNRGRQKKLDDNLKRIFKEIHEQLEQPEKNYYEDKNGDNYFQLREDWWTANRETVWKAMTCSEQLSNAKYFRATCDSGDNRGFSQAKYHCRCTNSGKVGKVRKAGEVNIVPTYFDYVPQFLRWFEEWAEDFCRKKKKKLKDVKTNCRKKDNSSEYRYCSLNGYDCEKTVNARGRLRMGKGCTDCFFACNPYIDWINNQKEQFDKQVKKYQTEIRKYENGAPDNSNRRKGGTTATNYEEYEKKFYDELKKKNYHDVKIFLEKLSNEDVCKKVDDNDGGTISFEKVNSGDGISSSVGIGSGDSGTNVESQGTFYRSKYCQPCPHCGMKRKSDNSGWEMKSTNDNCNIKLYKPKNDEDGTKIKVLKSGEGQTEIAEKLKEYCDEINGDKKKNVKNSLYEDWKCYKHEELQQDGEGEVDEEYDKEIKDAGGLCILQKNNGENVEKQKTFNDFFNIWVAHMLKDSIHWRTEKIKRCINNNNGNICKKNKCDDKCKCYESWVQQKQEEWKKIEEHYEKEDFGQGVDPYVILEFNVQNDYFPSIQKAYPGEQFVKEIEKIIVENSEDMSNCTKQNNSINELLQKELNDATKCKECTKPEEDRGGARILDSPRPKEVDLDDVNSEEDEEEDVDDDNTSDHEDNNQKDKEEPEGEVSPKEDAPPTKEDTTLNVCSIVDGILTDTDTLQKACPTKYGSKAPTSWKCISDTTSNGEGEAGKPGKDSGSICIPPRRRRLYIGRLTQWADRQTQLQSQGSDGGESQVSGNPLGNAASSTSSHTNATQLLRQAFIESAAVETFFLWHRYKQLHGKKPQNQGAAGATLQPRVQSITGEIIPTESDEENKDPQEELKDGTIPEDFKRQMFYTLGDYKDIFFGDTTANGALSATQKDEMEKIKNAIDKILNGDKTKASGPPLTSNSGKDPSNHLSTPSTQQKNSGQSRSDWWDKYAKDIWKGMVCSLTHKTETPGELDENLKTALMAKIKDNDEEGVYHYRKVVLNDQSETEARRGSSPSGDTLTLDAFVKRPPYFRYLEEWGETFCRERAKRLEDIKDNCRSGRYGDKTCSGDGFDCNESPPNKDEIFKPFLCSTCARHCRYYKKWIKTKRTEFEKQKGIYVQQKQKYETEIENAKIKSGNIYDDKFVADLKEYGSIHLFLKKIKGEPCKKHNDNENVYGKDSGNDKLDFTNPDETFVPAKDCKPCSQFKVKCNGNSSCSVDDGTKVNCNRKNGTINAEDIGNVGYSTKKLHMLVSGKSTNGFEVDDLKDCKDANIFKFIRKEEWKCRNVCGVDICTLEKTNNNGRVHEHITVKEFVKRWLETFFEDYNRIQIQLKSCTEKGKGSPCIKKCVDKWVEKKREEWNKINNTYTELNENKNDVGGNNLTTFLQEAPFKYDVDKAIKPCKSLGDFKISCGLDGSEKSKRGKGGEDYDLVLCLLDKLDRLKKKISECASETSGSDCTTPPDTPPEEPLEEEDPENKVAKHPKFCNIEEKQPQPVCMRYIYISYIFNVCIYIEKEKKKKKKLHTYVYYIDPIHNQLDLFHKWLDRHRNMCEQWDTNNKKEELLDKLKEEWNKENNTNSGLTHISSNMPSDENSIKNVLNTDVSIQIDMDDPKPIPINEFTNMDTIIDNLEKYSEPYYDIDEDDITYFDIDDEKTSIDQNNMDNNKSNIPTKVQIEMNVINNKELLQKEYPISDIWNI